MPLGGWPFANKHWWREWQRKFAWLSVTNTFTNEKIWLRFCYYRSSYGPIMYEQVGSIFNVLANPE